MLRRQKEFDLSDARIIDEAYNLIVHLKKINVVPRRKLANPNWVAQSGPGAIDIGYEPFRDVAKGNYELGKVLYEVLVHEIYHSISRYNMGETGFSNRFFASTGLNELINECAANRAALNYSWKDRQRGIRETGEYGNLTLFSP